MQGLLNYTSHPLGWFALDDTLNPLYIREGIHYQMCYLIAAKGERFNMA